MNQFVIGDVHGIDFEENFKLEEYDLLNFINDSAEIDELIKHPAFLESVGHIAYSQLSVKNMHFSMHRLEGKTDSEVNNQGLMLLALQKFQTQTFLTALWLIKDNSVNTNHFYWWDFESGNVIGDFPKILFSDSKGEYAVTRFSVEEIEQALEMHKKIMKYNSRKNTDDEKNPSIGTNLSGINNFNKIASAFDDDRISRAFKMIISARSQSFLPAKIASYISAIEALVSSNRESLVMQVSERVPKVIGDSQEDKLVIHDNLREAYNIRSKYVHGDKVSDKIAKRLEEISENIDTIIRRLLIKIINDYEHIKDYNENSMTKWYKETFMF
ncbi:HEPN domain-containing protein [Bacillus cereus]|uniref:HEPN domain-containing protein n=1 Tax=Bacillus cereus TaxID=1396 RepID=UPI002AC1F9E2|nr:HEPN domain-containing protein [Bacillus cereus]MDZ4567456.1 HEPN domain-containing protein [Bacillus cereus]